MEGKKTGGTILMTIGWLSVVLLTLNLIAPLLMFFPICIGIVLRRDYNAEKQGLTMTILGVIGGILGWVLSIYVINNVY